MLPIGKNMAGKRGASNHAASAAATAAATAATAALAAEAAAAALAAKAVAALAAEAAAALAADAAAALAAKPATTARAAEAATTALPPSPMNKRPSRACNSPNKSAKIGAAHEVVGTTEESAEALSAKETPATSYNMRKRLLPPQGSSSQNDEENSGDEYALDKDDDSDKDDDLDKDDEAAVELTPKKVLPVIENLKRGRGRPPKPSSPQGTSNPYP